MGEETEEHEKPNAEGEVEQSPEEQLANVIYTKLTDDNLASEDKRESVSAKIATGQMAAEDWRLLAAAAIKKEQEEAQEAESDTAAEEGG